MAHQFVRREWRNYSRLGTRRKKKRVWRSPKGRHNKMREKRKGYPSVVEVGYKRKKKEKGTINEKKVRMIMNLKDLEKAKKDELLILGKLGKKKKLEILKLAKEKKLEFYKIKADNFINRNKRKVKENKKEKKAK